ncbi:transposase [Microtetraspora sp. NBRC 13810]|uniref:transposase n=1 Tax=Microtetraspora sp. NBRC 13810 TaxID=3030990 RepID=UPI00255742E2|nr:transposase [Microtetraspora sp. NBRC 13810]
MNSRFVGPDGIEITPGVLAGHQVLRLHRHGRLIAECVSVAEVARHVDLADLCEVIPFARREAVHTRREAVIGASSAP